MRTSQPTRYDALSVTQQQQFAIAPGGYDGGIVTPEQRFVGDDSESSFLGYLARCEIGDQPRFDLRLYAVDSGRLFQHNMTETIARVIQGYFQCEHDDDDARHALSEAIEALRAENPRSTRNPLPRLSPALNPMATATPTALSTYTASSAATSCSHVPAVTR